MAAKFLQVVRKQGKQTIPTEYSVELEKNKFISIFKDGVLVNTFALGDSAEYDSYNLKYYGRISSISETTVCVKKSDKNSNERAFMDLYKFCWRNQNFDEAEVAAHNHNEMMYL